jgi:hypothetical protein
VPQILAVAPLVAAPIEAGQRAAAAQPVAGHNFAELWRAAQLQARPKEESRAADF